MVSWDKSEQRPLKDLSRTKDILAWLGRVPLGMSPEQYREMMDRFHEFMEKVRKDLRLKDALSNQSAAETHVG